MGWVSRTPPSGTTTTSPPGRSVLTSVQITKHAKHGHGSIQIHQRNLKGNRRKSLKLLYDYIRCWFKSDLLTLLRNVHAISGPVACTHSDICGEDISKGAGKEGKDVVENIDDVAGKPSIMFTAN